jgi:hypothetical protein
MYMQMEKNRDKVMADIEHEKGIEEKVEMFLTVARNLKLGFRNYN